MLSDTAILSALDRKAIRIDPFEPFLVQPASVDLRLGRDFRVFRPHGQTHIDPSIRQDDLTELVHIQPGEAFVLHPGEFALAHTYEHIRLDEQHAARVEGKSSLGRLGLICHSTAGFVDPNFSGQLTLELANVNVLPIKLWPGMRIAQLCVFQLAGPVALAYGHADSRYQYQTGPTPSRSWKNWKVWDV